MTQTLHFIRPSAVLIAEYWNSPREQAISQPPNGMGFDPGYADGIWNAVRGVLAEARGGADAKVNLLPLHGVRGTNLRMHRRRVCTTTSKTTTWSSTRTGTTAGRESQCPPMPRIHAHGTRAAAPG